MCGRYTIEISAQEIMKIVQEVEQKQKAPVKTGEIYPTNQAPVLLQTEGETRAELMGWGFPNFRGSGVIINARAETAAEKKMFAKSLTSGRCAVPSTGFYEWTREKEKVKYKFNLPESPVLYMAGLYREYDGESRYVILTTAANGSMAGVHNRMPVVLTPERLSLWLESEQKAREVLEQEPPWLVKEKVRG